MNILNKQIDSIYDRQKNLYSKYPHYSQQNAESKKVCEQEKITATSGKDVLGITKGDKENSYIVHFSDSAMVSRAVARGYVTVNGKEVELTEDTKQQLLKTDKEASTAREKAYQDYVMQHSHCTLKICYIVITDNNFQHSTHLLSHYISNISNFYFLPVLI